MGLFLTEPLYGGEGAPTEPRRSTLIACVRSYIPVEAQQSVAQMFPRSRTLARRSGLISRRPSPPYRSLSRSVSPTHQHRTVSARSHRSFWLFVHVAVASAGSLLRRIAQPAGRKQVQQNRAALAQLAKS